MLIATSRFGQIEVDEQRLITFPEGMLGFPDQHVYALIQTGPESVFYWLQCTEQEDLAFVVSDPRLFVADYNVPVRVEDLAPIALREIADAQVFIVVNKVDNVLTGNFQGPLVVNVLNRQAKQLVVNDRRYSTRHPLMRLTAPVALGKAG
jgi:flagellar assembly factor FliW